MNQVERSKDKALRQKSLLPQTARDTEMGALLRRFWHPVALSRELKNGTAKPLRVLSEDLTLYRGASGRPYLVGGRCAHRLTLLHTGWVQGEEIRCVYHGWKYNGGGQCTERPAEKDTAMPDVQIDGYPLHEYCGLVFAYLGEGPAPIFDLPRKDVFEREKGIMFARAETWPCNWFQQVENSMDATHVSFVHQLGLVGPFGTAVTAAIPELSYAETDAGIEQVAVRSKENVRKSNWTFPNNNHIIAPGLQPGEPWIDVGIWMVPNDDEHTTRFLLYSTSQEGEDAQRTLRYFEQYSSYNPADHHDALFEGKFPQEPFIQLTSAQDYIAAVGQGAIADTANELLGWSDMGIMTLRRIFWRELEAARTGCPTKHWKRLPTSVEMPTQPGALQAGTQ